MNNAAKRNSLRWISGVAGSKKIYIVFLMLIHMLQGAASVSVAVILEKIVNYAVLKDKQGFGYSIGLFVGVLVFQIVLAVVSRILNEYTYSTFENVFKGRLFSSLLKKDYASVTGKHSGEWMNRLTSDTTIVADGLTHILPGVIGMLTKLIGALSMIFFYLPGIAYIIIPGGAVLLVITYGVRKVMKKLHKDVQEADGRLRVFLQDNLGSMMVVRAFAKEENAAKMANAKMADHRTARMKKNNFSNICNVGFAAVMNGVYIFCVGYCCLGIISGEIAYGTLIAIMQLVGQVQSPIANITAYLPKYYAMIASAERLMEVEYYDDELCEVHSLGEIESFYSEKLQTIGIRNGSFSYVSDDEEKTLHNIDIKVNKGEFVALTGQSGCGKSTLLKLLMCLYPLDDGEKYIIANDIDMELDSKYKRLFAYVPQGNHLMSGTIREVVSFYDKDMMKNDEKINEALKIACADEFISGLKDGVDTLLGERGCGLSEGQMQRVAIARAIFSDSPILLLDEATSALDENTERQVLMNIRRMTEKTVIIVTHRPAALDICDRKIEML